VLLAFRAGHRSTRRQGRPSLKRRRGSPVPPESMDLQNVTRPVQQTHAGPPLQKDSRLQRKKFATQLERLKLGTRYPTFGGSQFDDSSLQTYGDGMSAVVRAELGEYIRDVALHCVLGDGKLRGDLFVRVPARDQPEHTNLARA
jgi:hypothetical protein